MSSWEFHSSCSPQLVSCVNFLYLRVSIKLGTSKFNCWKYFSECRGRFLQLHETVYNRVHSEEQEKFFLLLTPLASAAIIGLLLCVERWTSLLALTKVLKYHLCELRKNFIVVVFLIVGVFHEPNLDLENVDSVTNSEIKFYLNLMSLSSVIITTDARMSEEGFIREVTETSLWTMLNAECGEWEMDKVRKIWLKCWKS